MSGPSFAFDDFLSAIAQQLDDMQDGLLVKAKVGRPVTWALKDVKLDLKVFVEVGNDGEVRMRTAAPNETGASSLTVELSTITREMIEENTFDTATDRDPRPIDDHLFDPRSELGQDSVRKLKSVGVRTVGQFLRLGPHIGSVSQQTGIPVQQLKGALLRAKKPTILGHHEEVGPDGVRLLTLLGANLADIDRADVRVCGEPVEVLSARPEEVVVRPARHHRDGQIEVRVGADRAVAWLREDPDPIASDPWAGGR